MGYKAAGNAVVVSGPFLTSDVGNELMWENTKRSSKHNCIDEML